MRIGAHVGVSGGWVAAVEYCTQVGAECIQVFAKSPRTWRAGRLPDEAGSPFLDARMQAGVDPVFTHTSYLINLGTLDPDLRAKSTQALAVELERAAAVGASGVVTHLGTDPAGEPDAAVERIAQVVEDARRLAPDDEPPVRLLLENSSGAGTTFGGNVSHLRTIADLLAANGAGPVGMCLDTCHAFAYGYDLRTDAGWEALLRDSGVLEDPARLGLIHANDSMHELGSRRDRHAWIGEGHIGSEGFARMMALPALADTPVVIEMPGETPTKDAVNIAILKELRDATATHA